MRFAILIVSCGVITACAPSVPAALSSEERDGVAREAQVATDSLVAAAKRADAAAYMAFMASDALYADRGLLMELPAVRKEAEDFYATRDRQEVTEDRREARVLDRDHVLVVSGGSFRSLPRPGSEPASGKYAWSLLWQRAEGRWLVLHFHQSVALQEGQLSR